jgi:hypothetical protein
MSMPMPTAGTVDKEGFPGSSGRLDPTMPIEKNCRVKQTQQPICRSVREQAGMTSMGRCPSNRKE